MSLTRVATIDSLRGFLLVLMTIDHLPGPHREYTFDTIGYFTVAEGFVFVSGLVAGLHGYDVLLSRGEAAMRSVFYRRARTLYLSQLILLALLFGVGSIIIASSYAAAHPTWQGYATAWSNLLHPLIIDPLWATGAAVVLLYQPPLFDVLPMYCLFIFFTPFFICWIRQGRARMLLGFSFVFWLAAQTHGMANLLREFPSDWYIHDFVFDPLGWQILFIAGCTIGSLWIKHDCHWRPQNGWLLLTLAAVCLGLYVRYLPTTMDWKIFLGHASYRGTLAPARLLSTSAILSCIGFWALRFPVWFTSNALARLGRNSLYIFLYQIALIYFVDYWCDQVLTLPKGNWLDLLLIAICTATLWIPARVCDQIKQAQRQRRKKQSSETPAELPQK